MSQLWLDEEKQDKVWFLFWIGSGHWTSERRQNVMLRIPFAVIISFPYNCEGVLWSFIDFLYVITSQHNHIKGRKYTEYLLIYRILPPLPHPQPLYFDWHHRAISITHNLHQIFLSCVRELSCHAIEFQGWTHPEKLFQLVPARSGLWTRSSCKVPILWRIPQSSPKKLNLNESMSIYLLAQYPSIQSEESKNIQQVFGLQWGRLSKLHRTSSTIRRIFTYQGWVWTAGFIDDLTITVPDSWQSITTLRLSFTFPAPTQLASGRFGVQIKKMDFWQ